MKKKNDHGVFAAVRMAAASHRLLTVGTVLCVAASVAASLLPPLLLARVIDRLTAGLPLSFLAVLLYFGSLALEGVLTSAQESLLVLFGQRMTHALRSEMSRKLSRLPAGTLAEQNPGEVAARFSGDVDTVEALFTSGIISMAADILCTTISIWCEYTLFFTSGFAASLLMLIIARMSLHFHLSKNDVIPRLNIFYVFTAIFIPLGSILLAHYIARTLSWRSLVAAIVLLLINVSVFSLYDRMIHLMQERHTALLIEKQNKAYQQQLQFMQKSQMRLRFLRHDMKNHLFQIKHFLETNDMEGMYTYINDLEDNLDLTQSITYTQHEAINSILNYKLLPLRTDGVALEVDVQLPDQLTYPIFDLNVLLGNLLDNAIEATALVTPKENQKITLKMKERFGALQLQVGNRFNSNIVPKNGTHKSDKINHGLGLKSVQEIVRRHHGKMWIVPEKDWFEINIILYDSNPEKLQGSGKSI